jgi:hypothetical protein
MTQARWVANMRWCLVSLALASGLIAWGCLPEATSQRWPSGEPAPSPQALPSDGPTEATSGDRELEQAWYERNFVQAYAKVGRRDPKWDFKAEKLIRNVAAYPLFGKEVTTADQGLALEVIQTGCDDPLVLYLAALAREFVVPNSREVTDLLERAVAGMHEVGYPRAVARWVASRLRGDYDRSDEGGGRRATLEPVELRWFLESLADGSYEPDEDVLLVDHLLTGTGVQLFRRQRASVVAALNAAPDVDPWVRHLFEGQRQLQDAWASRGGGYASDVTEEGWKGFRQSLAKAREALSASWKLRPDRPEAAAIMVNVALSAPHPDESPRTWFDRTVAARFDYMPAYDNLLNALRQRWGGSDEQILSFARECAETRRFDTPVPERAYVAIERIEKDRFDEAGISAAPEWPEMRPGSPYLDPETYELVATVFRRYRRDPAAQTPWQFFASLHAAVAYKAREYEESLEQLHDVGGQLNDAAHGAGGEPLLEARIETMASEVGQDVLRAGALYREGSALEAAKLLRGAIAASPEGARPFIEHRLAIAELEAELQGGDHVDVLPKAGLGGWSVQTGEWEVASDGSLIATSGARGFLIVCESRVGPDFEIAADIEVLSTSNDQFQAGIVFGHDITFSSRTWSSFRVKKNNFEGEVMMFTNNLYKPADFVKRSVPTKNHVVVRSLEGRLWAWVDGESVISNYAPPWPRELTGDDRVGFGAYLDDNVFRVRYSNVKLRRLDEMHGPLLRHHGKQANNDRRREEVRVPVASTSSSACCRADHLADSLSPMPRGLLTRSHPRRSRSRRGW